MNRYFICILFLCASLFANLSLALGQTPAPLNDTNRPAFTEVQQQLSSISALSGKFKQTQQIQLLSSPLISEGYFTLSKTQGVSWQQTSPFKSTLSMTQDKMTQRMGDNPETVITKEKQPVIFSFANIFLSLFQGNIADLQQYFTIQFSGTVAAWHIILIPKASPLNKAITTIDLTGGKYIQKVVIKQVNHNQTTIDFYNIREQLG